MRFDYRDGQTRASGPPVKVTDLPSAMNHHWTKALAASADGRFLYVGIGSNSNITERGMEAEVDRAMVWQVDAQTGAHRPYATGLRNPTALAIQPGTGQLWAVVNERDEIGPNLVPDYLTSVRDGGFYGWPYSYWGQNVDPRVAAAGSAEGRLGDPSGLQPGIARRRARRRLLRAGDGREIRRRRVRRRARQLEPQSPVGYKVVFVPFRDGRPAGTAGRLRLRLPGRGRQDPRPAGRGDRRSARRPDRRRRPVEHDLENRLLTSAQSATAQNRD